MSKSSLPRSRSLRWLVPAGTAGVVAAAVIGTQATAAGADPVLPQRTAADLLAAVGSAHVAGLSGTVATSSDLGLPSLGALTGVQSSGPTALTSGTHVLRVWTAGEDRQRVTLDDQLAEYSVVRRGAQVFTYDSAKDTVSTRTLPTGKAEQPSLTSAQTPQDAAKAALAAVDPSTTVSVDRTARVAGRSAYQLVLTPKDARSLVGSVRLAVDSATSVPLRVQVFARGAKTPAVQVGFTSVDLTVPDASVFDAPTGKAVPPRADDSKKDAAPATPKPTDVRTIGTAWTTVVTARGVTLPAAAAPLVAQASTPVTVSGVSGRLLKTTLVSALLMDDGRAYAGAVTPETLTAAAAK